jgi:hypothetical protein
LGHPFGFLDRVTGQGDQVGVEAGSGGAGAAEEDAGLAGEVTELFGVSPEDAGVDGAHDDCCGSA